MRRSNRGPRQAWLAGVGSNERDANGCVGRQGGTLEHFTSGVYKVATLVAAFP
jgi:hypothetical protein